MNKLLLLTALGTMTLACSKKSKPVAKKAPMIPPVVVQENPEPLEPQRFLTITGKNVGDFYSYSDCEAEKGKYHYLNFTSEDLEVEGEESIFKRNLVNIHLSDDQTYQAFIHTKYFLKTEEGEVARNELDSIEEVSGSVEFEEGLMVLERLGLAQNISWGLEKVINLTIYNEPVLEILEQSDIHLTHSEFSQTDQEEALCQEGELNE